jgi:predicted Kef-type K+ transport protein
MKGNHPLPLREVWVICFLLGIVMLNYPFLHIFNKNLLVLGFPLPILYLLIGWPISIFIIYLFSLYLGHDQGKTTTEQSSPDQTDPRETP